MYAALLLIACSELPAPMNLDAVDAHRAADEQTADEETASRIVPASLGATGRGGLTTSTVSAGYGHAVADDTCGAGCVQIGLSIHVEGWADTHAGALADHVAEVDNVLDVLADHGGAANLELTRTFLQGVATNHREDDLARWVAAGNAIGGHADISPDSDEDAVYDAMEDLRVALDRSGQNARFVSGVCSEQDWVGASMNAGFEAVTGLVEFCLKAHESDTVPGRYAETYEHAVSCAVPGECHDPVPAVDDDQDPWRTASSADWLADREDPDASGALLIPGRGQLDCAAEVASGAGDTTGCPYTAEDNPAVLAALDEAIAAASTSNGPTYFYLVQSVGERLDRVALENLMTAIEARQIAGKVRWTTIPEIVDNNP